MGDVLLSPLATVALDTGVRVRSRPDGSLSRLIVIAPPGGGNVGDEALVESVLRQGEFDERYLVTRGPGDFDIDRLDVPRTRLLSLPGIVYGRGPQHVAATRQLMRLVGERTHVAIIGADIMDGAYNPLASVNRFRLATISRMRGADVRVIGFSWNRTPHAAAIREARRSARAGVLCLLRDPQSFERFGRDVGTGGAVLAADAAFTLDPRRLGSGSSFPFDPGAALESRIAVVNVSGLVGKKVAQTDAYVKVVERLRAQDYTVVLVPHVIRATGDDASECAAVASHFGTDSKVVLCSSLLAPRDVQRLLWRATLCVTGRMHLAVFALNAGVPPVTIATQGKVEGLLTMFDLPELIVPPTEALQEDLEAAVAGVLGDAESVRHKLEANRPKAIEAARRNFLGFNSDLNRKAV